MIIFYSATWQNDILRVPWKASMPSLTWLNFRFAETLNCILLYLLFFLSIVFVVLEEKNNSPPQKKHPHPHPPPDTEKTKKK